uniref:Uncharacterized protein AlNc14C175G8102 n=1 Tax=Albugo laibachii Nc14 TaxID=890382 RepID=F0WNU2_9STRA|nr:conserved hypothetical protein [Albugo laibachii Nc14]|eukprot:CCA22985.1 conserved hypothetical protein [Albugo laibachii Nc14]
MTVQTTLGYVALVSAILFYGSCYVPAKRYHTYDGIIYQWFMCSGILITGLIWGLLSNDWMQYAEGGLYVFPQGLLGGSLFAIANLLIPTVVNTLGLGLGFMLWNGMNITMGYLVSRYGLLGVQSTVPHRPILDTFGILLMIGSIAVYGFIRPTLSTDTNELSHLTQSRKDRSRRSYSSSEGFDHDENSSNNVPHTKYSMKKAQDETFQESLLHPELPNYGPYVISADLSEHIALMDATAERKRQLVGTLLAILLGAILSTSLIPFVHWQQDCEPHDRSNAAVMATCNPLNFVFSQCLGIYLTSTIAFLLYSLFHRFVWRKSMPRSVMRPAYVCGVLWALGLTGQLFSAGVIGFDQVYPLSSIGPAIVSMLWSAVYFKEIQGIPNLCILAVATSMVLLGTILRAIAA